MREALKPPPPPRRPTRPTRAATEERLEMKRRAGARKRLRRPPRGLDE
jgi:ribosome-associated protein